MKQPKTKLYKDNKGEWRWTIFSGNGKIVGASSEGFKRKFGAVHNYRTLRLLMSIASLACVLLFVNGCSTTNFTKILEAAAKDPACVHMKIMTPYGSMEYDRANTTNKTSVGENGIIVQ